MELYYAYFHFWTGTLNLSKSYSSSQCMAVEITVIHYNDKYYMDYTMVTEVNYLDLSTECFMKICLHSTGREKRNFHETVSRQIQIN